MKLRLIFVLLCCVCASVAQTNPISLPFFPSGEEGVTSYFSSARSKYTTDAEEAGIGVVYVSALLNHKGRVDSVWVVKGLGEYRNKRVMRMISKMPRWRPALKGKEKVYSQLNFAISYYYEISKDKEIPDESIFIQHPKALISAPLISHEYIDYVSPNIVIGNDIQLKIFYANGVDALHEKNYAEAIEFFTNALALSPKDMNSLYNRGVAYFKSANKEKACEDWKMAASLGDKEAEELLKKYCGS